MLLVTVKMLPFLEFGEILSGSKETPSSSDGGGESDESDESDESNESDEMAEMNEEMDGELDGDSSDAARTSERKNPAAVEIVIQVDKLSQD
ncbi:hypothetical protein OXX79_004151 [Metschnikowia pulcherrima]